MDAKGHIDLTRADIIVHATLPLTLTVSTPGRVYPIQAERKGTLLKYLPSRSLAQ